MIDAIALSRHAISLGLVAICFAASLLAAEPTPAVTKPAEGLDWPLYQGGAGFTGVSPDASVRPPFKLVWTFRMDGDASGDAGAGVTVGGGKVYVNVSSTRSLLALDADTGRLQWEYSTSYLGYRTTPSYSDGRLFLWERGKPSRPRVLALDAEIGKPVWEHALRAENLTKVRVGLPVADGKVYCAEGGEEPKVTALDEKSGKTVWSVGLGKDAGHEINQPSVAGGKVFVAIRPAPNRRAEAASTGAVIALDAASGKERWRRRSVKPSGRPLYTDGQVIACCFVNESKKYEFSLLDANNGQTLWTFPAAFSIYVPPAATIGKDVVLIKPYGGSFFVAERKTGRQLARYKDTTNSGCGTTVIAGGYAYVGTGVFSGDLEALRSFQLVDAPRESGRSGSLHVVDLKTGESNWYCGTGNTVCGDPAIAYGRLYFTSRDGRVYCFEPAKPGEKLKPDAVDQNTAAADSDRVRALVANKPKRPFAPGTAWPMAGGDPDRAGLPLPEMKAPLKTAWKFELGDRISCGAAIADGNVFIGSDAGKLVAIEGDGGAKLWQFDTGAAIRCSPAVADNHVYCGSDSGAFYALDRASGEVKWRFPCGGPVQASPAVAGDVVLFAASDHHVYALNRLTGKKLWSFRMRDFPVQAPPVVHGGQVFVAQWNDWIYALDLYTGEQQWRAFLPISIEALAYYRDKLYARLPNYLVEIDPRAGKRLRVASVAYGYGGAAFLNENVFLSGVRSQYGSPGREIISLSQTGTPPRRPIPTLDDVRILRAERMKGAPGLSAMTAPLVLGETLCFAALGGNLQIVKPDGERLWTAQLGGTCHSPPVAVEGLLVVGCDDGYVYAFRGGEPDDSSSEATKPDKGRDSHE